MKFSGTRNFPTLSELSEKLLEVTPPCFKNSRHKTHKTLLISLIQYPYCPQFLINHLRTREYCTVPICNLSCTPKLMQRHYTLSKIEKNGMNGIIFFFSAKLFVYLSTLSPAHIFAVRGRLQR